MNQRRAYLGVALFTLVATCSSVTAADSNSESRLTSATAKLHAGQYDECLAILRDINDEQLSDDVLRAKYRKCLREAEDGLDQQNQARRDFELAEKAAQRGDRRAADRYYRLVASNSLGDAALRRTAAARLMNNNDAQPKVVLASAESISTSFAPPKGDDEKSGDKDSEDPPADDENGAATKPESKEADEKEAPASDDAAKKDEPAKDEAADEAPAESESNEAAPSKKDAAEPAKPDVRVSEPARVEPTHSTSVQPTTSTPPPTNLPVSSSPPGTTGGDSEIVPVEQLVPGTMPPSSPQPAPATPARSEPSNWPSGGTSIYSNPPPKSPPPTMMQSSGGGEILEVQPVSGDVRYTSGSGSSSSGMAPSSSGGAVYSSPGSSAVSQGMGASNLVDSVVQEQELLWQQAVKTFTDTEDKIRAAITAENFNEANTLMDYARQTIESNRRNAYPASRYDEYKQKADDLSRYISDEEKKYAARQVDAKTAEVRENEIKRASLAEENKRRLIEQLMTQAEELSKERRYDEAIGVLKQVQAVDPANEQATFMREVLEGTRVNTATFDAIETRKLQTQEILLESEEDMIPWHHDLQYPRNWPEITARRKEQTDTGDSDKVSKEATRKARRKLKKLAPEVRFESQQLDQVVKYLRDATGLNIIVQWTALEQAGIEREKEINLELVEVSYEKVLDSILESLGAETGSQLAYEIDDGVLTISTKEAFSLNPPPPPVVYDVTDLTFRLVDYRAVIAQQLIQLIQTGGGGTGGGGQGGGQGGGAGGGGLGGGGGGVGGGGGLGGGGGGLGGGGGGGGGGVGGGGMNDTGLGGNETQLRRERIDELKQLIQDTIDPESWRDAGGNIGSIASLETQIVVTQTVNAHKQIQDLLRELRRERSIQIAIEARFVTITRNFLEQIGVDLDVILNSGNAGFDQASNGSGVLRDPVTGSVLLIPRQFSRLGFTPGAPAGIGVPLITGFLNQPYRQPGLVPSPGDIAPHSGTMSPIPIINNTVDLSAPAGTPIAGSLGGAATNPAFTMFGSFLDNIQVDFLLRASQLDNRASDLDAPRVVISNGQRASFESFLNQQFVSGAIPVIGDNVGLFQPVVSAAPTGRSLDVQGFVSADRRYVSLNLRLLQVVSSIRETFTFQGPGLLNGGGALQLIDFRPNIVQTTVTVPDGGTLLIGGLKLAAERERDAGVPVLSRVPVLKRAFSNTSTVKDDQILLILVRPKIIIQDEAEQEAFPTLTQNE